MNPQQMQAELDIVRQQREEYLTGYRKQVIKIREAVEKEEAKKKAILAEIADVKKEIAVIKKEALREAEIITEEAKELCDKTVEEHKKIVEMRKEFNKASLEISSEHDEDKKVLDARQGVIDLREKETMEALEKTSEGLNKAGELLEVAEKQKVVAAQMEIDSRVKADRLDRGIEDNRAEKEQLIKDKKLCDEMLTENFMNQEKNDDERLQLIADRKQIDVRSANIDIHENELEHEYQERIDALSGQAERNEYRSRELDLGFEKLNNDQIELKKGLAKLKSIQKEVLKKGE